MAKPCYPEIPGYYGISASDILEYLMCGARYWFSRRYQWRRITNRMAIGSAVGVAAKCDNKIKMAVPDSPGGAIDELIEIAVESFKHEIGNSEMMDRMDGAPDIVADATRTFKLEVSPLIKPVWCEEPILAKIDDGNVALRGTPDYFTEDEVLDLKVGKNWTSADVATSIQLTIYAYLFRSWKGVLPEAVGIDNIVRTKRIWRAQRIYSKRNERDFESFFHLLRSVKDGIDKGVCIPAAPNQWHCSSKWCPYFQECKYVGSARRKRDD